MFSRKIYKYYNLAIFFRRKLSASIQNFQKPITVLGIETSCDDTACAIVDNNRNILGEAINSQHLLHLKTGGILPPIAYELHKKNITNVCERVLEMAHLRLRDLDAIATTVEPGLPMSLLVGLNFGKYLSRISNKPFIPIHHMKAHALTIRLIKEVDFPYLALLISGGHTLLTLITNVDKFYILGTTNDNSLGQVLDKVARRLRLHNIPEFSKMCGGQAIEEAAKKATDLDQFPMPFVMPNKSNCMFSFSGLLNTSITHIIREEKKHNITADNVIPSAYNLAASLQFAATSHICHRIQRAMEYIERYNLIPKDKQTLVISGGAASNNFIANALDIVCSEVGYKFIRTPPRLCTDNGIMIAWNGIEKWIANSGILTDRNDIEKIDIRSESSIGEDWSKRVESEGIKCKWVKIRKKLEL